MTLKWFQICDRYLYRRSLFGRCRIMVSRWKSVTIFMVIVTIWFTIDMWSDFIFLLNDIGWSEPEISVNSIVPTKATLLFNYTINWIRPLNMSTFCYTLYKIISLSPCIKLSIDGFSHKSSLHSKSHCTFLKL